jgi:hypothetical protein
MSLLSQVHPISPQEEHQQEGNGKHRPSQAAPAPEVLAQAKTASPPSAPRPSHTREARLGAPTCARHRGVSRSNGCGVLSVCVYVCVVQPRPPAAPWPIPP